MTHHTVDDHGRQHAHEHEHEYGQGHGHGVNHHKNAPAHAHAHQPMAAPESLHQRMSLLMNGAAQRVLGALVLVAVLWLAVAWAVRG